MRKLHAFWDNLRVELQRIRGLDLKPTDIVLDVGSGNRPSPRANVLCDRFILADAHRFGKALVRTSDRLMVGGNITQLPFADAAFDFVICSHVLEHLDDPATAMAELQRVARAGYIETPSPVNERLMRYEVHRWITRVEDGELVFTGKTHPVPDPDLAAWFADLPDRVRRLIYMRPYESGLSTCLHWEKTIPYRIEGRPLPLAAETEEEDLGSLQDIKTGGTLARMMSAYGRWLRRRSDVRIGRLADLLICPACRSPVTGDAQDSALTCTSCGRAYPVIGGIPRMTPEEAVVP